MNSDHSSINQHSKDSRTQLPDRDAFYRDGKPWVDEAAVRDTSLTLLCIDVEGLQFVLRAFGPTERDALIREVGHRIRDAGGGPHTPYHITQDRFAVVVPETGYRQVTQRAQSIIDALTEPFDVVGVSYRLEANVGISQYPNHANSLDELVRTSVFACHKASKTPSSYEIFDTELDQWERHQFRLMVDLEQAMERNGEVRLAYQPIVKLENGRCAGVEGLCRWQHTELGMIPPGDFLPYVEHTSLMMPLTETVLADALQDLAQWRTEGFEGVLAINLSPTLFRDPNLLDRLLEPFAFTNMTPANVRFEVTETGIMDQPNRAINTLTEIRERGSGVAVDDFGTGHSSLASLADLPIDSIKIDKYFVQNLSEHWGEAIVGAAATLADKLGLETVAEGIEDETQLRQCGELGVTYGQGFYLGRPMFQEDFRQWLIQGETTRETRCA